MAKFITGQDIAPTNKSSNDVITLLESMSPVDISLASPYIRIRRIDQETNELVDEIPISTRFIRPPEFGKNVESIGGERPRISLNGIKVSMQTMNNIETSETIEISLVIHRPDTLFETEDDAIVSLFTPGLLHQLEYGWTGTCKHPLLNGDGFQDPITGAIIPSKRSLLFTTSRYSFSFNNKGEAEISIFAYNSAGFSLQNMRVAEILDPVLVKAINGDKLPLFENKNREVQSETITRLQKNMIVLSGTSKKQKGSGKLVKLLDVLNEILAEPITVTTKKWGYHDVDMKVGNFSDKIGITTESYGKQDLKNRSIGDFYIPLDSITSYLKSAFSSSSQLTVNNFICFLFNQCNLSDAWDISENKNGKHATALRLPNVRVIINEYQLKGKNILSIIAFDEFDQIRKFGEEDFIFDRSQMKRAVIKEKVISRGFPFITLGKGFSFIKDASFEARQDSMMQTNAIIENSGRASNRQDYIEKTYGNIRKNKPEVYQQLFMSAIEGNITMHGNFALNAFSQLWLDVHVPLWSGQYIVHEREDIIDKSGFETKLRVVTTGDDPLNIRRKIAKEEYEAIKQEANKLVENSQKKANDRKNKEKSK